LDLFEKNPNPMWIYDAETLRFLDVNQSAIDRYGWSRDEFLGMTILEIVTEANVEGVRSTVDRDGMQPASGPWRHRYKDGSEHLVRITSYAADFASRPAHVVAVNDVTKQRQAEDALRMSEAELRALTDQLPVALLYVDVQGKCRRANRAFEEWFDLSREKVLSMDFEHLILRGDGNQYEADVRRAWALASQGTPARFEKTILVHGKKRTMEATYTPDIDQQHRICGVIVLLHDITERRALEEQFRHAQKMEAIGRLAGGIAHDFNNILSVMNGYASILQQEIRGNERLGHMAGEIHRAGERAARLTQQLLAFSRKQISQPRIVRADDLLRDDETMLRRLVSDTIFLEMHPAAGDACVEIDPHRFSQVLLNLVVNARDAMPQGGRSQFKRASNIATCWFASRTQAAACLLKSKNVSSSHFSPQRKKAKAPGSDLPRHMASFARQVAISR
jgi:two-component system cell cycle sensor histidine kinase/response regulator CckA